MQLYKMDTTKQINIKDQTYYFYNDIIDLDKKSYKDINTYNIGYVTHKK